MRLCFLAGIAEGTKLWGCQRIEWSVRLARNKLINVRGTIIPVPGVQAFGNTINGGIESST